LLVKFLDNLPFGKALSETAVFFLMFNKLSHLMFGWFIQPFHISVMVIKVAQRLKQTLPLEIEVENYE